MTRTNNRRGTAAAILLLITGFYEEKERGVLRVSRTRVPDRMELSKLGFMLISGPEMCYNEW